MCIIISLALYLFQKFDCSYYKGSNLRTVFNSSLRSGTTMRKLKLTDFSGQLLTDLNNKPKVCIEKEHIYFHVF